MLACYQRDASNRSIASLVEESPIRCPKGTLLSVYVFFTYLLFKEEKEVKDFNFEEFFKKQKKSGWFADYLSGIEKSSKCKDGELVCYLINKYGHFE